MNAEGYKDPTAERAIRKYNRMPHRIKETISVLNSMANLIGLEIVSVRDKRTGKEYRKCEE